MQSYSSKLKTKNLLILGVFLFALFGFAKGAQAATYYVAKTGNNSNTCAQAQSASTPKLTIVAGAGCLSGSDTLYVRAGTYNEGLQVANVPSGTAGAHTILSTYPNESVTLVRNTFNLKNYATPRQYIDLIGFRFDYQGANGDGIHTGAGSNILIQDVEVLNTSDSMGITGNGNNITIRRAKVHDGRGTTYHNAIYVNPPGDNWLIEYNEVYHFPGQGIQIYGNTGGMDGHIVRYNYIHDIGAPYQTPGSDGKGQGIVIGSGSNQVAYNNIVANIVSSGSGFGSGSWGIAIFGGMTGNNNAVYNNTIYNVYDLSASQPAGIEINAGSSTGHIVRNNIVYLTGGIDDKTGATVSNNLTTNPSFVNAGVDDFHLQSTSLAINAGATLSEVATDFDGVSRPQGSGYDIGAYEYVSSSQTQSADLNSDSRVNSVDAAILMGAWGQSTKPKADINQDGIVNSVDASLMMGQWTP